MRNERGGGIGSLLNLILLVIILFVGYQFWIKELENRLAATMPTEDSAPPIQARPPAEPAVQPILRESSQVRLAAPGEVPASIYAVALGDINLLLEQGNEAAAQSKLVTLPQDAFNDQRIRKYAATLWNNLGVIQTRARGAATAVSAYKTAVSLDPTDPTAHLNLAHAYWELKDPALTREFLEKTIGLAPDDPLPHLALAELLLNKDDLSNATTHLQHAKERVSESPTVQSFLTQLMARVERTQKAEQKFLARESSHFQVKFDGNEDHAVWNRVAEILEEAYREIGQQLGHFPGKPILVVLHTRETFHDATGGPAWSDGLYDPVLGRIKIPTQGALMDQAWLTRVLRHEFVHALLHDRMGGRRGIPQWLNEGLAMQLAGDPPPDIPELVRGQITLINLTYLEGPWGGLTGPQAMVAYLEGNSATHYFIDRFGMDKVREVLGLMATGQPFAPAFQDRLFITYDQFQQRWIDELNEKLKAGRS